MGEQNKLNKLHSVFENEKYVKKGKDWEWVKEIIFYRNDFSNVDLSTDWRFKEVKNNRKELKLLGTVVTSFPLTNPLILDNGIVLDYSKYCGVEIEEED